MKFLIAVFSILLLIFSVLVSASGDDVQLNYCYDARCQLGCHPSVRFDGGACASWTPGTSQMLQCGASVKQTCVQGLIFNRSLPGGKHCERAPSSSVPVPCEVCLPDTHRGGYVMVTGCDSPAKFSVKVGCSDNKCTECNQTVALKTKACQHVLPDDWSNWYLGEPEPCVQRPKILHWSNSSNCDGPPDKMQAFFENLCYGEDGTGAQYVCPQGDDEKKKNENAPPLLSSSSSSFRGLPPRPVPTKGNVEVHQCASLFCSGGCQRVATYYNDACIAYGADQPAMEFECRPSKIPNAFCVPVFVMNQSKPGAKTCAESAIEWAVSQRCEECSPEHNKNGEYFVYTNCSDPTNFGLKYGCDAKCQVCRGETKLPLQTCQRMNANTTLWYGLPGACGQTAQFKQFQSRRCWGPPKNVTKIPAGKGTCVSSGAGVTRGSQYYCV